MKVYISIDMEGISGVVHVDDVAPGNPRYDRCRALMTADCNAAIEGALAAGATEIVVNDAHWIMRNLLLDDLHPAARVIAGVHKDGLMVAGLDSSFAAAFFIGYHARQGRVGVLSHTLTGREFQRLCINGEVVGEVGVNALLAAAHGVPVVMVTGDEAVCAEAREGLGEAVVTVAVKRALDRATAECLHPSIAQERIRAGAERALAGRERVQLPPAPERYVVELDLLSTTAAWACGNVPGAERTGDRSVRFVALDAAALASFLVVAFLLASSVSE